MMSIFESFEQRMVFGSQMQLLSTMIGSHLVKSNMCVIYYKRYLLIDGISRFFGDPVSPVVDCKVIKLLKVDVTPLMLMRDMPDSQRYPRNLYPIIFFLKSVTSELF